eukprot:754037-Hanusia_phi.AAC.2
MAPAVIQGIRMKFQTLHNKSYAQQPLLLPLDQPPHFKVASVGRTSSAGSTGRVSRTKSIYEKEVEMASDDAITSESEEEEEEKVEEELQVAFGDVRLVVDEKLFDRFNSEEEAMGVTTERQTTMSLGEAINLVDHFKLIPTFVSKTDVVRSFRLSAKKRNGGGGGGGGGGNSHELSFAQFKSFMSRLQDCYMESVTMLNESKHKLAATVIQRRMRGMQVRKKHKRERLASQLLEIQGKSNFDDQDLKKIIRLQAIARANQSRKETHQQKLLRTAMRTSNELTRHGPVAIRARRQLEGRHARIQKRLQAVFDQVADAFTYLDNNGDFFVTQAELRRGFQKLRMDDVDMAQLGCSVSADGKIDLIEFMRLFAWKDVVDIEEEISRSKLRRSKIVKQVEHITKTLKVIS